MRTRYRTTVWSSGLAAALAAVILVSANVGPVPIDLPVVAMATLNAIGIPTAASVSIETLSVAGLAVPIPDVAVEYTYLFSFSIPATSEVIVREIRLPRIVLGAVVGFALGTAGAVMQGFFRNPMADPSIIGVSTGAAVGAVATIALPLTIPFGLQTAAFVGAVVTAFGVYVIATTDGRTPVATLLLAGVAVQTFLGAVVSFLLLQSGESLREAVYWLMGRLSASGWGDVEVTLPVVAVLFVVLVPFSRDLNVLMLGEEDAQTLGVPVEWTKRILLAVSSVMTAAAVAVAGVIGFVGLIVPHVMRLLVGPDHQILLPTSALAGATFLVATDTLARSGGQELPVGIITAALGAPFFLFLLTRREVHEL